MLLTTLAVAGALAVQTSPQQTPPPPPTEQTTAVEDVVVVGRQLDEQISNFLDAVTLPEANMKVSRWNKEVCVSVVNMRNDAAQYMVDRVSQVAMDLGLKPGEPGCKANVTIIAALDAKDVSRGLVSRYRHVFRPDMTNASRNRAALRRFVETDAAVRWWHISILMESNTNQAAVRLPGDEPAMVEGSFSRLRSELRTDIASAIIVLDIEKMRDLNLTQIADYAAMVALSQLDLDADFAGYDSILALENDRQIAGLTEWDMTYLKALYSAELTSVQKRHQVNEIGHLMQARELPRHATSD